MSVEQPTPAPPPAPLPDPAQPDPGGYRWRYVLNAALGTLAVVSAIGNFVTGYVTSGAWLGLSDITWHWTLVVFGAVAALNALFNRTPPVTKPPTSLRLAIERQVHALRRVA